MSFDTCAFPVKREDGTKECGNAAFTKIGEKSYCDEHDPRPKEPRMNPAQRSQMQKKLQRLKARSRA